MTFFPHPGRLNLPALLIALALAGACSGDRKPAETGKPPAPVILANAVARDVPIMVKAIGTVQPSATVSVKALVGGQVMNVNFREGQEVRKGEVLFVLDTRSIEASLRQAEAVMLKDSSLSSRARETAVRYASLAKTESLSQEQYEQAEANARALEAQVKMDEAAIENLRVQLEYCTIRSPIDGRTGEINVDTGNVVKAYDTVMVVINQIHPIDAAFTLPESSLTQIQKKMSEGRLPALAYTSENETSPEEGVVSFIDNEVNRASGTVKLKATFGNRSNRLWPGQFVNVYITLGTLKDAVTVPQSAVQAGQNGQYVYVAGKDMTAELRPVISGESTGDDIVITKGVAPGETVVSEGHMKVYPGAKLIPKQAAR